MRPLRMILASLTLLAAPAAADERLSAEEFSDYATGYTIYYESEDGERYGSESFDENGFVTWRSPNGQCVHGGWRAYDDDLCFLFEGEVQCWAYFEGPDGRYVRPVEDEEPKLRVARRDRTPLSCFGEEYEL